MTLPAPPRSTHVVWELTLKCNLGCIHCGSRAGPSRDDELSTAEALDLVRQLDEIGMREVTLIGGEAYLRPDWLEIAAAIVARGIECSMVTGGYGLSRALVQRMRDVGMGLVSVSVDGLEATHDRLRGRVGSWKRAFASLQMMREAGMTTGCNTQINRLSAPELPLLYEYVRDAGAVAWQLQMTVPMGNAADNPEILLQPPELLDVFPMLATLARRAFEEGVEMLPGNNVGYYGPYERLLRGNDGSIWTGCQAGLAVLGVEANGAIKGCPSLPTAPYTGGNIREQSLRDIVEAEPLTMNVDTDRPGGLDHLWGFCRSCDYAALCRGGCSWTAHTFFDRRGNNPYCHHRALVQARHGRRERLVQRRRGVGLPFDNGEFELVEEAADAPWPADDPLRFSSDRIQWPTTGA